MALSENCEGCKYRENNDNCNKLIKNVNGRSVLCSDSEADSCMSLACPEKCYLPYPKDFYKDEASVFYYTEPGGQLPFSNLDTINKSISDREKFKDLYSKSENIKEMWRGNYDNDNEDHTNLSDQYKCGPLLDDRAFPSAPGVDKLQNLLDDSNDVRDTKWDKIKIKITTGVDNSLLNQDIINNLNAKFSNIIDPNGVDINQMFANLSTTGSDGLSDIDDNEFKEYMGILLRRLGLPNTDSEITKIYDETVGTLKSMLEEEKSKCDNDNNTCSVIDIYEKLFNDGKRKLSENIITEWANKRMLELAITGGQIEQRPMRLIDVFMITEDDSSNFDLETRLNYLMDTGLDPDEEKLIVERIGKYTSIEELGRNPRDVEFIEKKIKKFLGANTQDLVDAFLMSGVSYEDMCNTGFSDRPMKILGNLMNVQTDASNLQEGLFEEKMVIKKLLKYIPSIMRKVLEIAEKVEMERCDRVSKKTQLYKEIYKDLFVESNVMKFELPDMGIFNFFEDFNRNIYTKIILLIILTFMISKIVSLFKVNVSA